jgi:RNA polymerase sigma-70 factor (ECF subfamily)
MHPVAQARPLPAAAAQAGEAWLEHHSYLLGLAVRLLGNIIDAEDIVQEAFTRLVRTEADRIEDIRGWLVVVVSRLCLTQLTSARSRHEARSGAAPGEPAAGLPGVLPDPADRATLDDSIRLALTVLVEQLTPAERAVFVLHDIFEFPFDAIAQIVGRTPTACRQLASRARRRIQARTAPARFGTDTARQHRLAESFIAACSGGDLSALIALLDPDVEGDVTRGGTLPGRRRPLTGTAKVAKGLLKQFGPDSQATLIPMPINGEPAVIALAGQHVIALLILTAPHGQISHIQAIADPRQLAHVSSILQSGHRGTQPP